LILQSIRPLFSPAKVFPPHLSAVHPGAVFFSSPVELSNPESDVLFFARLPRPALFSRMRFFFS